MSKADRASALSHTQAGKGWEGVKPKLKTVPIKHCHRETFVQLASCISQPKAGIPPLLPRHLILDNFSLSLTLITTVPPLTGLLWSPNEIMQE